ncbi:MAG TPA: amylosucrase [Anaerolineales bacterium]|nr:amylosucrase [Anaerolineales bacterium]HLO28283.1 amylosucrase [Anaerolineales bacterium]
MIESQNIEREAQRSLNRILPRVEGILKSEIKKDRLGWIQFSIRLQKNFPKLFRSYADVYSHRYDFFFYLEDLIVSIARLWFSRSQELRELDSARESNPYWFEANQMLGAVCYADLFAENLEGIRSRIPYFKELGITYLHLMPLFKAPKGENDGGYAVSSYRELNPALGSMEQLNSLASDFRKAGISLVLDLVFNHTSDEHIWAERAKAGNEEYMDFYRIFPSRELPDRYEQNLREIFPGEHPGAFTFYPTLLHGRGGWVWTTFHSYQWDLNYSNPAVFNRMAEEMLFLANQGVEVLRLDAIAFIWKQLGTNCENLPQAHTLTKAFNAVARIAAPALTFKSEAIVHPDDVVKYVSPDECQISYNPLLMALLWNSLATREVRLLSQALVKRFKLRPGTAWVNYVRVHDDIGWTFSDEDAAIFGVNGRDHRCFLNEFYRGRFPGSFARGLPFQENPVTGDCRISGTCASLAGLEKAVCEEGENEVELAIRRILLLHGIIFTAGGIPLIYLGDEIGRLNDYTYRDHPAHERDSRWVHRPRADWEKYAKRNDPSFIEGRVYQGLQRLISLRKENEVFSGCELEIIPTENDHVLGYMRRSMGKHAMIFANFTESPQSIPAHICEQYSIHTKKIVYGTSKITACNELTIEPMDFLVLG